VIDALDDAAMSAAENPGRSSVPGICSTARRGARVACAQVASLFFAEGYLAEWATAGALLGVNYGAGGKRTPVTLRDTATRPVADPDLLHPYRPNSVSGSVLFVLCFAVPAALVLAANLASAAAHLPGGRLGAAAVAVGTRDVAHFMLSLFEAYALSSTWKVWLNVAVGRQRPDWYARLATGDAAVIAEGRLSYPSGHSAYTHASAAVCALYVAARLRVFARDEPLFFTPQRRSSDPGALRVVYSYPSEYTVGITSLGYQLVWAFLATHPSVDVARHFMDAHEPLPQVRPARGGGHALRVRRGRGRHARRAPRTRSACVDVP
jgi:hypothetical protein